MGRIKSLGGKLWRNFHLVCAGLFVLNAVTTDAVEVAIPAVGFAIYSVMLWERDRAAGKWRELTRKWQAGAQAALAELQRRDAVAVQWSDFCASVQANTPEDQREAVQYAMDLAVASHAPVGKAH